MKIIEWLFFGALLCFAWFMGMAYERGNTRFCVEPPPRAQTQYPKTKAEMKKFIAAYKRQGEGWIK